jgi:hypothetical protein
MTNPGQEFDRAGASTGESERVKIRDGLVERSPKYHRRGHKLAELKDE